MSPRRVTQVLYSYLMLNMPWTAPSARSEEHRRNENSTIPILYLLIFPKSPLCGEPVFMSISWRSFFQKGVLWRKQILNVDVPIKCFILFVKVLMIRIAYFFLPKFQSVSDQESDEAGHSLGEKRIKYPHSMICLILGTVLLPVEQKGWEEETRLLLVHLPPNKFTLETSRRELW